MVRQIDGNECEALFRSQNLNRAAANDPAARCQRDTDVCRLPCPGRHRVELLDTSGQMVGELRQKVRDPGVPDENRTTSWKFFIEDARLTCLRNVDWQGSGPVAKIAAVALDGFDQADNAVAQSAFYAIG